MLTTRQDREIFSNLYNKIQQYMIDRETTPENLAKAMTRAIGSPGNDLTTEELYEKYLEVMEQIKSGYDDYGKLCDQMREAGFKTNSGGDLDTKVLFDLAVEQRLGNLTESQRKGLCLMLYENFREADVARDPELDSYAPHGPDLALMSESQLREMVVQRADLYSECLSASVVAAIMRDEDFQVQDRDFLIVAAALYGCSEKGVLPREYEVCPELLGAAAGCGETLVKQDWTGAGTGKLEKVISALIVVLIFTAIVAVCATPVLITATLDWPVILLPVRWLLIFLAAISPIVGYAVGHIEYDVLVEKDFPNLRGWYRNRNKLPKWSVNDYANKAETLEENADEVEEYDYYDVTDNETVTEYD